MKAKRRIRKVPKRRLRARRVTISPRMRVSTIPAAVNTASRIRSTQTRKMDIISNTDRLIHTKIPKGTAKGSLIYDQIITPAIAQRLRTQAALFQKIRYIRLRFEVQTQTPTTNGGGYVVSFLHDPKMDVGSGETALRALTAVQGTQTSKFWQSINMNVKTTTQQYFTLTGDDVRLYSPGRFVVMSDGEPTEDVSITILFHWTVELTKPALQRLQATYPQVVLAASCLQHAGQTADDNRLFWSNMDATGKLTDPDPNLASVLIGAPPSNVFAGRSFFYEMPYTVTVKDNSFDHALEHYVNVKFIELRYNGDVLEGRFHRMPILGMEPRFLNKPVPIPIVWQHTRLNPVVSDEFFGNANGNFLMNASESISVNKQPMISKEFLPITQRESETNLPLKETILEKLSLLQLND
jgi:hypothetical protein